MLKITCFTELMTFIEFSLRQGFCDEATSLLTWVTNT